MAGIPFPEAAIPPERQKLMRAIANGEVPQLSLNERSYLAGIADQIVEKCPNSAALADRSRLVAFIPEAVARNIFGTNYSGSDLGSVASHNADFIQGALSVRLMGCANPFLAPFAANLGDLLDATRTGVGGGAAVFIRSCSQARTRHQCECISGVGQSVIADIYGRTYSGALVREIISRNPLLGFALMEWGVVNY